MRLWLLVSVGLLIGCASMESKPEALVLPWSEELAFGEAPLPFLAKYTFDGKALYYLATEHANNTHHPTFRMLLAATKKFPAQVYLLEGFETEKGDSPQDIKEWAMNDGINGHFNGGEPAYAIQLAIKNKVSFLGLEPSEQLIFLELQKEKITAQDMVNYYFLRQLPQWKRANTLDVSKIQQTYSQFVNGVAGKINSPINNKYVDFLKWYKQKNKEDFDPHSIDSEKSAPYLKGKYYTQRLSAVVGRIRDRHMVSLIAKELKTKERVLVVLGGSHWMTQKPALEAIAGFPSFEFKEN